MVKAPASKTTRHTGVASTMSPAAEGRPISSDRRSPRRRVSAKSESRGAVVFAGKAAAARARAGKMAVARAMPKTPRGNWYSRWAKFSGTTAAV